MKKARPQHSGVPNLTRIAALIASSAFASMLAPSVLAQTQPAPAAEPAKPAEAPAAAPAPAAAAAPAAKEDVGNLERIVITATSQAKSKLRSSVSVTDVDQEQIRDFGARTEAEVMLLIPGIRTDATAGPGGNANISVRGLPIASGGSKYVQLQEDGLPTVQFGDMNFSNNDYWIRFDNNVESIQTLRGGSSSVFASHAPGAVLNYISKTGKQAGGEVGLTRGLNYNETRFDGDYGGRLAPDLYFHFGGYYRQGEGARHYTDNALLGYQLKGNLTKEFNGGKGYFRVNFKLLDEHAPTTPQTFLNAKLNGTTFGSFSKTPGYDGTRDSQYSIYNATVPGIDPITGQRNTTSLTDGITVNSKSVGFEFHNELANGFSVDNKFRKSSNSGAFQAQFWDVKTLGAYLGTSTNEVRFYNGPLAGQAATSANLKTGLVSNSAAINTQTPDMGNLVNDLSVSKQFKLDAATLDLRGGLFFSRQNVVQRWMISERLVEVGRNGAVLDLYDGTGAAGNALTTAGLTGYNNQWGGCCARDIDATFTTTAPYAALSAAVGNLDVDVGLRRESFKANGSYAGGKLVGTDTDKNGRIDGTEVGGVDVNNDGSINGAERNVLLIDSNAQRGLVNYKINYTNYSLGANYRITNDLSAFVRHSKGNRAIADRLLFSANINAASGLLSPGGGATAALAPVKQSELGMKMRGNTGLVNYGVSATFFHSTTTEFDYDQTRQDTDPNLPNFGPKLNIKSYKADGLELETAGSIGNLGLNVNVVYSNEKITGDLGVPGNVGKTSGGVPKWRYNISPRYAFGPAVVGATIRGQGKVFSGDNNVNTIDGHFIVNAFVNYEFGNGITAALNVNNLFDKVYPTGGGGFVGGSSTVFGAGVETGRTINASVRYAF
jgi:outer membrane receptor protein involved in Fe transport